MQQVSKALDILISKSLQFMYTCRLDSAHRRLSNAIGRLFICEMCLHVALWHWTASILHLPSVHYSEAQAFWSTRCGVQAHEALQWLYCKILFFQPHTPLWTLLRVPHTLAIAITPTKHDARQSPHRHRSKSVPHRPLLLSLAVPTLATLVPHQLRHPPSVGGSGPANCSAQVNADFIGTNALLPLLDDGKRVVIVCTRTAVCLAPIRVLARRKDITFIPSHLSKSTNNYFYQTHLRITL